MKGGLLLGSIAEALGAVGQRAFAPAPRDRVVNPDASDRAQLRMDTLSAFGLFAVTAMLVFYAVQERSPWFILDFAAACALGSIYGFPQGAWPFGVIEAIWAGVAVWKWRKARTN
jgi:hypothetical protein